MSAPREAIAAVLRRADGRYLLIRRAAAIPAGGFWSAVTGRPEPGEPLARALEREVREETGLAVRAGREVYRCLTHDGRWMLVWLEAELVGPSEPLALLAAEVAEARWATAAEALELAPMFDGTRRFFEARAGEG